MANVDVAAPQDYLSARLSLLEKEKEWTRLHDSIMKERRALPLVEVTKDYTFVDADTKKTLKLADAFQGRRQLIVYHAMFEPTSDAACPNCTFVLDHIPPLQHLQSHNTTLAVVSLAPADKIAAYKSRLGLDRFPWLSSYGTSFNTDYGVTVNDDKSDLEATNGGQNANYNFRTSAENKAKNMPFFAAGEQPGHSIFVRGGSVESGGIGRGEEGKIYHSYSSYARGGEVVLNTLQWLDMTPLGRQDDLLKGKDAEGLGYRLKDDYDEKELSGK